MKVVELGCFIVRVQGCYQRVACSFHRAVCQPNKECRNKKAPEALRKNGEQYACQMKYKGKHQQSFHPDNIHQHAADNYCKREAPECSSCNGSQLFSIQMKLNTQPVKNAGANSK